MQTVHPDTNLLLCTGHAEKFNSANATLARFQAGAPYGPDHMAVPTGSKNAARVFLGTHMSADVAEAVKTDQLGLSKHEAVRDLVDKLQPGNFNSNVLSNINT